MRNLVLLTMKGRIKMSELSDVIYKRVTELCSLGDKLVEEEKYSDAIRKYFEALDLLPKPETGWEASTWILTAIGDTNFIMGNYEAGRDNLVSVMHCPGAIGNPFIHMRLGQCRYELGEYEKAADELARAFLIEGEDIFKDEDKKYLDFVKSKLQEPKGGWNEDKNEKSWWKFW
jgi:tetratricopeptide (TPR) repeat protein